MKNKIIIALLVILINAACQSQEVKVFWGKENPLTLKGIPALLTRRGDNLLGYMSGFKRGLNIVKYSFNDLQVKNEYPLIGQSNGKNNIIDNDYTFNNFIVLTNKTYVGVSMYNRKTDLNSFYAQEISDEGKLTGEMKKLSEISSKSRINAGAFEVIESEDSSKILMVNNPPFEKYGNEKFGFKIFDEQLNEINNLEVALPYKDKFFSVKDYILSKDGNIYMLSSVELEKKAKEKGEAGYYYEIVAISPANQGQVTEYKISLPKKYITDVSYKEDGKYLICAGFYNNIEVKGWSRDEINGIFYLRINKETKEIESKGIKELDKSFIAELTSDRKANKGRGISSNFKLENFIQKDDGGAILIAENSYNYTVQRCNTDPKTGSTTCRTDYHYVRNNIIAININSDGSIKWYTNIPKYQHTINDGGVYSSYMLSTAKDKIYFIYNDNPKNLDPTKVASVKDIRPMGRAEKSTAALISLSEDGTFNKKAMFSNKENKVTLLPKYYKKVGGGQLIVPAINRGIYCCLIPLKAGKYRLARFEFK